ncbi:MAG: dihydrofolate reductase family protein [Nocardioidaceae bacterium]
MRVLVDRLPGGPGGSGESEVDGQRLRMLYAPPRLPWLRVNMVTTLDGAATGGGGRSGDINSAADKRGFDTLRSLADAVVVGAGTARTEGYHPTDVPLVVVSRRGEVPEQLCDAAPGDVWMVTCAASPGLSGCRDVLGAEHVVVCGDDTVDLVAMRAGLVDRGFASLLGEGGPRLLADLLAAGVVDELCVSLVPLLVGGPHPRITSGGALGITGRLALLLEEDGTLLGRWFTSPPPLR